jgi:hypothetical protein
LITSLPEVCRSLATPLASFLALLLAAAGVHKMIARHRLRTAAHELAGVPRRLAPFAVAALAVAECLASLLLWIPQSRAAGAAAAVLLWGGYCVLMLRAIAADRRDVDCGCSFGAAHGSLGAYQAVRNAALAGLAALVAVACARYGAELISPTPMLAAFALFALYVALDQAMALQPPRAGELP